MARNIIIKIEACDIVDMTENLLSIPNTLIIETAKPVSKNAQLIAENHEKYDEPMTNLRTPLQTDRWIYRIVVSALAFTIVSCIGSAVWLQLQDKKIPEILTGLGTGALGGLAGLLAPTPSKD